MTMELAAPFPLFTPASAIDASQESSRIDASQILPLPVFHRPWQTQRAKPAIPSWPDIQDGPPPAAAHQSSRIGALGEFPLPTNHGAPSNLAPFPTLPFLPASGPSSISSTPPPAISSSMPVMMPAQPPAEVPVQRPTQSHGIARDRQVPGTELAQVAKAEPPSAPAVSPVEDHAEVSLPDSYFSPFTPAPTTPPPPAPRETQARPCEVPQATSFQAAPPAPKMPDFTDDDLREAIAPLIAPLLRGIGSTNIDLSTLEPMMRSTVRRALAEHSPSTRPFQAPGFFDRIFWHLRALFTSRTYDEIFFEKTRRFAVEETFLLDVRDFTLVSYASADPARHASANRVASTASRLALRLREVELSDGQSIPLSDGRSAHLASGQHFVLAAIIRGTANELVTIDLKYLLQRVESRYGSKLHEPETDLLLTIQPYLEDSLLIQAPSAA